MKNIFRILMAVAVLFTASCAKEDISSTIAGGEANVTFTVDLPELGTRAETYGKGASATTLRYYVYDGETLLEDLSTELPNEKVTLNGGKATVTLPLLKGMTYNIVFWADNGSNIYSYTPATKSITVDYTNAIANDDSRDAFYKYVPAIDPATATNEDTTIVLTRPFAQLNAATSDLATVEDNEVTLTTSTVKVNTYTQFDLVNGIVLGEPVEVVIFEAKPMPCTTGETLPNKPDYTYLSMNYLLPGTVDAVFTFKGKRRSDNSEVTFTGTTYTNVPLKSNYRTNILGALLTKPTDFTVTIDAVFSQPDQDIVQTAAELQQQIINAPDDKEIEIVLGGDIDLNDLLGLGTMSTRTATTQSLTIPAGKNITLNLNGCTLSATEESTVSYGLITNKGTLTISDSKGGGKMQLTATQNRGWNAYSSVISNQPGGVLTVNGGTIEHLGGTDMAYGIDNLTNGKGTAAVATINGGTVKSTYRAVRQFLNGVEANNSLTVNGGTIEGANKSIWMQDPSKNSNTGTLVVAAEAQLKGNVYLTVTADSTEWPVVVSVASAALQGESTVAHGDYLPAGYSVVKENGVWTVKFTHIANIGEDGYDSIQAAVAAVEDGETIIVNRNATFDESNRMSSGGTWYEGVYYVGDKSFTIDLNNNTISQNGAVNDYMFLFKNDGEKANTITFKNGTIDAGTAAYCALCTSTTSTQKITINLEGVNLIGNNSNGAVAKIRGGAELNVKTGTVITGNNSYVGIEAVGNNTVVNINEGAKIYQNGTSSYVGSLAGASNNATLNVLGGEGVSAQGGFIAMTSGGTINISGGNWTANTDGAYANSNKSVLISQSAKGAKSTVNVTGGTFKGGYNCYGDAVGDATINISGGNFNADPSAYVVAGKAATENNGIWTIIDAVSTAEALVAALAQGGVVTLGADITVKESVVAKKGVTATINLNGKTLTAENCSAITATEGAKVTVKGNGNVVAYESVVRAIGGEVIVENGTFTQTGTALDSPATYRYAIDSREGGKITIDGGTFTSGNGMINVGSEVIINGGKFENIVEKSMTRHFAYVSAPLTINNGEFYGKANGSAGGCFFCGAGANGNIQINGGKFTSLWTSGSVNRIFEVYFGGKVEAVTGGLFNTNGGIATFVTENTDAATKAAYPYVAK